MLESKVKQWVDVHFRIWTKTMGRLAKRTSTRVAAKESNHSKARRRKLNLGEQQHQQQEEQREDKKVKDEPVELVTRVKKKTMKNKPDSDLCFVGLPVSADEALKRYPDRYKYSSKVDFFSIFFLFFFWKCFLGCVSWTLFFYFKGHKKKKVAAGVSSIG